MPRACVMLFRDNRRPPRDHCDMLRAEPGDGETAHRHLSRKYMMHDIGAGRRVESDKVELDCKQSIFRHQGCWQILNSLAFFENLMMFSLYYTEHHQVFEKACGFHA